MPHTWALALVTSPYDHAFRQRGDRWSGGEQFTLGFPANYAPPFLLTIRSPAGRFHHIPHRTVRCRHQLCHLSTLINMSRLCDPFCRTTVIVWLQKSEDDMPVVDLAFPVTGDQISSDHGYVVYSALSREIPKLHRAPWLSVHPISGVYLGDGTIRIPPRSSLRLRLPSDRIGDVLALSGKRLMLGDHTIRLGIPKVYLLEPAPVVRARLVTIRGFMEEKPFLEAVGRQLDSIGMDETPLVESRLVVRIQGKAVVGFGVRVENLSPEHSIRLQEQGVGGRRRMGCGIFVPVRGKAV